MANTYRGYEITHIEEFAFTHRYRIEVKGLTSSIFVDLASPRSGGSITRLVTRRAKNDQIRTFAKEVRSGSKLRMAILDAIIDLHESRVEKEAAE